jgi:hypothetical protein
MDGYSLIRCDRARRRGGGVCLFLRKGVKYEVLYKSGCGEMECLLVRLSVEGLSLNVLIRLIRWAIFSELL